MPRPRLDSLIFDLDDPLIDSSASILAGFAAALDDLKIAPKLPLTATASGLLCRYRTRKSTGFVFLARREQSYCEDKQRRQKREDKLYRFEYLQSRPPDAFRGWN